MKPANKAMQKFLGRMTQGLEVGDARRLASEGYMPLVIERIGARTVSLAHYGQQNGDAMRDPDVVFWRGPDALYYPIAYRNDFAGEDRTYVEFEAGVPVRIHARMQRDLATFCGTWVRNIAAQAYETCASEAAQ